jgi:hypothetical protein
VAHKRIVGGYRMALKMAIEILSGKVPWGYYSHRRIIEELQKHSDSMRIASTNDSRRWRAREKEGQSASADSKEVCGA